MQTKLLCTTEYGMFTVHEFNRDVKKIGPLLASMKRHGFIPAYPLHCQRNCRPDNLIVKAGHHRLEVAKTLGLPVYYVVSDDEASITELESATNTWKMLDYVSSYARQGKDAYVELLRWANNTGISIGHCASMLAGEQASSSNKNTELKAGTYKVTSTGRELMGKVGSIVQVASKSNIAFARKSAFVNALSMVCLMEDFDHDRLMQKISQSPHLIQDCPTTDMFLSEIESAYNNRLSEKVPVAFLAKTAAKSRSVAIRKK